MAGNTENGPNKDGNQREKRGADEDNHNQHKTQRPMRECLKKFRRSFKGSATRIMAIATIFLAAAAIYTAWENSVATQRAQRAYVFAKPREIVNINLRSPPEAYVTIENVGQTPAYELRQEMLITPGLFPTPADRAQLGEAIPEPGHTVLHPGGSFWLHRGAERSLSNHEHEELITSRNVASNGDQVIYVLGTIMYLDIFKERHYTKFCFMFFGNLDARVPGSGYNEGQARQCDKYNDAN